MQLEHLSLFLKIAQEKSISKVAGASHISQPALSLQMQKIEELLGCKLFERSNRGIRLTDAGLMTQRYAEQLIFTYHQFLADLSTLRNPGETFRIMATQVAAAYAIPGILAKAKERFPGFTFTLTSMPSHDVIRYVWEEKADIGFIVGTVSKPGLYCRNVFSDQLVLIATAEYNVRRSLSMEALKSHPLVLFNESSATSRMIADQIADLGYSMEDFTVSSRMDSTEAVKSMVAGKNGLSFLPYMAVKNEVDLQKLKIVDTEDFCLRYDVSVVYKLKTEHVGDPMSIVRKYFEHMVPTARC